MRDLVEKFALQNALLYGGEAQPKAVVGKVLASDPSLRSRAKEVAALAAEVVAEVNRLDVEAQRTRLEAIAPELLEVAREAAPAELPDLPDVEGGVVMRLAPYPSGPLHIGNARMVVLNDAYVKRYGGRLLLVHDDTIGSGEKLPVAGAYDLVEEGLRWLGVEVHATHYKSDRLEQYYAWGERLLEGGHAYACLCAAEALRANREAGHACEHRAFSPEESLAHWARMLDGTYGEGEAVVRLRTDMADPNPAFRDRVLFRISERPHPRVGTRHRVWPLLELSWAVDDHLLGITHVLRGKDLVMEDAMEEAIWARLGVEGPAFIHHGRLRVAGAELSKSAQRRLTEAGELTGPDDPRTWSLQSLARRGIRPEAVRAFIQGLGLSLTDIEVPVETLYTANRRLVDPEANRYFFVPDPVSLRLEGMPEAREAHVPLHPDFPERGVRTLPAAEEVAVPREDARRHRGGEVRLKDWCNVRLDGTARFTSWEVKAVPKIQWLPEGVEARVLMPDGQWVEGLAERAVTHLEGGTLLQFERFGFVRLEATAPPVAAVFAHR